MNSIHTTHKFNFVIIFRSSHTHRWYHDDGWRRGHIPNCKRCKSLQVSTLSLYKYFHSLTRVHENKIVGFFRPIFQGGEPNWRNLNHGSCWTYAFANEKPFPARRKGVCNRKRRLVSKFELMWKRIFFYNNNQHGKSTQILQYVGRALNLAHRYDVRIWLLPVHW